MSSTETRTQKRGRCTRKPCGSGRSAGTLLIFLINDRVDIALAAEADGVHLGQSDMPCLAARKLLGPEKIIGVTVHNLAEALQAESIGADYLGVSPIFQTATKPDAGKPAGISLIEEIRAQVEIPLIAIGGINHSNASEVVRAGADGLCAISCVVAKENVRDEIIKFQKIFSARRARDLEYFASRRGRWWYALRLELLFDGLSYIAAYYL